MTEQLHKRFTTDQVKAVYAIFYKFKYFFTAYIILKLISKIFIYINYRKYFFHQFVLALRIIEKSKKFSNWGNIWS
jgi:hypothetical protein